MEKAEIDFSAEVRSVTGLDGSTSINARICSKEQRESDFLPKVSYKLKVTTIPATEGIMRLTDTLSTNQMAKKLDTTPVAPDGMKGSEEQKNMRQEVNDMKARVKNLKLLYQKISELIAEQDKLFQISKEAFKENVYSFDKDKYLMAQSNITNKIMKYQEKIMDREIEYGLIKDYEK